MRDLARDRVRQKIGGIVTSFRALTGFLVALRLWSSWLWGREQVGFRRGAGANALRLDLATSALHSPCYRKQ
jgi:hypothetical protein